MTATTIVARNIMRAPPETVLPTQTIWAALAIMRERDIRHLLVVRGDELVGVLSNRDYRRILERLGPDETIRGIGTITVAEIMTPAVQVVTALPDTPLRDIAQLVIEKKIGCVPIVASGRALGIVTQKDVLAALLNRRP